MSKIVHNHPKTGKPLMVDGLVDPWFLSDLLCLMGGIGKKDASVCTVSNSSIVVSSESNSKKRIGVDFELGELMIVIDSWTTTVWNKKDYLSFKGFAQNYGLTVEDYINE